jgi:hypothetical protein
MNLALANESFPNATVISKACDALKGWYRSGVRLKDPSGIQAENVCRSAKGEVEPLKAIIVTALAIPATQMARNENQPNLRTHVVDRKSFQSS